MYPVRYLQDHPASIARAFVMTVTVIFYQKQQGGVITAGLISVTPSHITNKPAIELIFTYIIGHWCPTVEKINPCRL